MGISMFSLCYRQCFFVCLLNTIIAWFLIETLYRIKKTSFSLWFTKSFYLKLVKLSKMIIRNSFFHLILQSITLTDSLMMSSQSSSEPSLLGLHYSFNAFFLDLIHIFYLWFFSMFTHKRCFFYAFDFDVRFVRAL